MLRYIFPNPEYLSPIPLLYKTSTVQKPDFFSIGLRFRRLQKNFRIAKFITYYCILKLGESHFSKKGLNFYVKPAASAGKKKFKKLAFMLHFDY